MKDAAGNQMYSAQNGAALYETEDIPMTVAFVIERSMVGVPPKEGQAKESMGEDMRRFQFAGKAHAKAEEEGDHLLEVSLSDAAWVQEMVYECFRRADGPDWEQAFKFALPIIGIQSWAEAER